jgi:DNA repair protein RadC
MTWMISDVAAPRRPRERLLRDGAQVLSDAELLAVILGTGAPGKNVIHLAQELLVGGVPQLHHRDLASLTKARGIGPAKAARIAAVLEMARRLAVPAADGTLFDHSSFGHHLVSTYAHQKQERLGAALLDSRHRVMKQRDIFIGTLDKTFVSPREIISYALIERAKGVVLYHNHPSGDPTPSHDDISFSKRLGQSLAMVDVELVDHLVIGQHRYTSMKEAKYF